MPYLATFPPLHRPPPGSSPLDYGSQKEAWEISPQISQLWKLTYMEDVAIQMRSHMA